MEGGNINIEEQYLDALGDILNGEETANRTGINTIAIDGVMLKHNMSEGFPLLTTKKVNFGLVASELEFFIKGITSKKWLQDRGNHIWNPWCSPINVPYGNDEKTKKKMEEEDDLGPIYGAQWRSFGDEEEGLRSVDQLKNCVDRLKTNPECRRNIVSAWNPLELHRMALVPCHVLFRVGVRNGKINLSWYQRSCDFPVGVPFNIASYALLLHLLAKETGYEEGQLCGFFDDAHIYENQIGGVVKQLDRDPKQLPRIETESYDDGRGFSVFNWEYVDTTVFNYDPYPFIKFPIAV